MSISILAQIDNIDINAGKGFFGASLAESWMSGIAYLALIMVVIGLVLSAGLWAIGAFSNNYTQSVNGKKGFLICAAAALAIGAARAGVNYFYNAGNTSLQNGAP